MQKGVDGETGRKEIDKKSGLPKPLFIFAVKEKE